MSSIRERIKNIVQSRGPSIVERDVPYNGKTEKYRFRVLDIENLDLLRLNFMFAAGAKDDSGIKRMAGNNARWVAATLVDDDGNGFDYNDVRTWQPGFIDALAKAAGDANGQNEKMEEVTKNSDAIAESGT